MKALFRRALAGGAAAALVAVPTAAANAPERRTAAAVPAPPAPPMTLPGEARIAAAPAARGRWIVGGRPGPAARALARRFGARRIGPAGTGGHVLSTHRARAFAAALERRGLLVYAQPDTLAESHQAVAPDPLSVPPDNWRDWIAEPALVPPQIGPASPLIALVDAQLDLSHGEWRGGNTATIPQLPITNSHGTATASVAAAPDNGVGILGVWPKARALNVPLPEVIRCSDSAEQIATAIERGAAVINMSYGSPDLCYPEYVALQFAVANGIVPVAAAGNEFGDGNPLEYPAALPHVLTVAAVGPPPQFRVSYFSNANAAIDVSAPGENIMTAVPPKLDGDGARDGYQRQSGTSFAAPMVAAAVAWVRAARPELSADQVGQAVRLSARDVGRDGWDSDTGFGVLSVGRALGVASMPHDPGEPNDDVEWVDGSIFGTPGRLLYGGRGKVRLTALLDVIEDPADVYRIRLRPRSTRRIRADPARTDDVALRVYRKQARQLQARPLERSARRGGRTETITLRNRSRRPRTYYAAVSVQGRSDLDATYALRVG
jgi:hypothetical protein